jgi:fatty-acyl-CoA synthase
MRGSPHAVSPHSLAAAIARHAQETPDRVAIAMAGDRCTYAELWSRVDRVTALLQHEGIGAGDRVAYLGLNHTLQIVLLAALMRLGAVFVPLNYRLAPAELRAIVEHAGATLLFHDAPFAEVAGKLGVRTQVRERLDAVTAGAASNTRTDVASPALLVYTSGTTGKPKGALHSQAGLYWNAVASTALHAFTRDDRVLSALPLFHVGGLCIQTVPALYAGAEVILHPRFDAAAWLAAVAAEHPSISLMVPATMRAAIEHASWTATDFSALRLLGAGSSTIPDALIEAFHARGVPVCQIYGATETGPVSIVLGRDEAFANVGAAGRPALGCAIRLVDEAGADVPDGSVGEVWVRGPNVMTGYWRDPAHPAFEGGWFRSGDRAVRDATGLYTIVGRAQDLIISGGENIYPAEIENLLAGMPEIAEAAVIGVPDARWGEVPVAAIVLRAGATLAPEIVSGRLAERIARFKLPRITFIGEPLPRNAMGKVVKSALCAKVQSSPRNTNPENA